MTVGMSGHLEEPACSGRSQEIMSQEYNDSE